MKLSDEEFACFRAAFEEDFLSIDELHQLAVGALERLAEAREVNAALQTGHDALPVRVSELVGVLERVRTALDGPDVDVAKARMILSKVLR